MQSTAISKQQVIEYLRENDDFFTDVESQSLLLELRISSNLPAGVSSFVEKQSDMLRAQNEKYKQQLSSLTNIAKENEALWQTLKQLCVFTLSHKSSIMKSPKLLIDWLKQHYSLSIVALKLPDVMVDNTSVIGEKEAKQYAIHPTDMKKELMSRISSGKSYCDNRLPKNIQRYLFEEHTMQVGSCAFIPLNLDKANNGQRRDFEKGVLILADKTSERFNNHVDMTYLNMLSDILTAVFIDDQAQ